MNGTMKDRRDAGRGSGSLKEVLRAYLALYAIFVILAVLIGLIA